MKVLLIFSVFLWTCDGDPSTVSFEPRPSTSSFGLPSTTNPTIISSASNIVTTVPEASSSSSSTMNNPTTMIPQQEPTSTMKGEEDNEDEATEAPAVMTTTHRASIMTTDGLEITSNKVSSVIEALEKETTRPNMLNEMTHLPSIPTPAAVAVQTTHFSPESMTTKPAEKTDGPTTTMKPEVTPGAPVAATTQTHAIATPPPASEKPTTTIKTPLTVTTTKPTQTTKKSAVANGPTTSTTKKPGNSATLIEVNLLLVCISVLIMYRQ